jgi:6-phosphogluconolactonase
MAESVDLRVLPDGEALAHAAAAEVAARMLAAVVARGEFRLALPGGRSPRAMLHALVTERVHASLPWDRTTVLFVDERALPEGDAGTNHRLVREALLDPLGRRAPRCVRMRGDADELGRAAAEYERELQHPLDLAVLGVGEDGHVASLFPGSALVADTIRHVAVVRDSPKPPPERLTLTPRALNEARALLVLASGDSKAAAVASALAGDGDPFRTPARLARRGVWLVDAAAAAAIPAAR